MNVIYGLIPGMILLGLVGVAVFFWAAKNGQFDDLEGEANRILMDDDLPLSQEPEGKPQESENPEEQPDKKNG